MLLFLFKNYAIILLGFKSNKFEFNACSMTVHFRMYSYEH